MRFTLFIAAAALLSACQIRDIRAEQQAECRQLKGYYHVGEDPDDDVCAITRENVIIFDNREVE